MVGTSREERYDEKVCEGSEVQSKDKVTYQGVRVDNRKMTVIGQNNRRREEIKTG
jgi:hypothetical protein